MGCRGPEGCQLRSGAAWWGASGGLQLRSPQPSALLPMRRPCQPPLASSHTAPAGGPRGQRAHALARQVAHLHRRHRGLHHRQPAGQDVRAAARHLPHLRRGGGHHPPDLPRCARGAWLGCADVWAGRSTRACVAERLHEALLCHPRSSLPLQQAKPAPPAPPHPRVVCFLPSARPCPRAPAQRSTPTSRRWWTRRAGGPATPTSTSCRCQWRWPRFSPARQQPGGSSGSSGCTAPPRPSLTDA